MLTDVRPVRSRALILLTCCHKVVVGFALLFRACVDQNIS